VQVDLRSGEQLGEAYRRINPQCTVPALRTEEGLLLADNAAIAAYLEARYPQPRCWATTPEEKAEIASWNWRMEFEGLLAIAEALRNSAPAMANRALPGAVDYPQIPALAERGLARVGQFFAMLNDPPGGPRLHCHRPLQRGRHHRRGGGGLCARGQAKAGRAAPAPAALARGHGGLRPSMAL
jgi:glutathione S-transferase